MEKFLPEVSQPEIRSGKWNHGFISLQFLRLEIRRAPMASIDTGTARLRLFRATMVKGTGTGSALLRMDNSKKSYRPPRLPQKRYRVRSLEGPTRFLHRSAQSSSTGHF